ncbi:hypothetical protein U1Q18_049376 [Sarracenia purpurea var. burkii]
MDSVIVRLVSTRIDIRLELRFKGFVQERLDLEEREKPLVSTIDFVEYCEMQSRPGIIAYSRENEAQWIKNFEDGMKLIWELSISKSSFACVTITATETETPTLNAGIALGRLSKTTTVEEAKKVYWEEQVTFWEELRGLKEFQREDHDDVDFHAFETAKLPEEFQPGPQDYIEYVNSIAAEKGNGDVAVVALLLKNLYPSSSSPTQGTLN